MLKLIHLELAYKITIFNIILKNYVVKNECYQFY